MKLYFLCIGLLISNILAFSQERYVEITNPSSTTLQDLTVEIPVNKIKLPFGKFESHVKGQHPAPLEIITDITGEQFAIIPIHTLKAKESISVKITSGEAVNYPKRTAAELTHKEGHPYEPGTRYEGDYYWVKTNQITLPSTFKNHSYYMKSEGPVWENDKVCFRLYLDDRNKIDVNGKRTSSLVMSTVGATDFEEEHKRNLWGMDNKKVGKSLGLGSYGSWTGSSVRNMDTLDSIFCSVIADGKLCAQIKTTYYNWETNNGKSTLTSLISLNAGSRASKIELSLENSDVQLATGINIDKTAEYIVPKKATGNWTYIATFGKQSMIKDMQGLVLFYQKDQVKKVTDTNLDHVVVFKKGEKRIQYYIMPTWELEKEPVKTKAMFMQCIDKVLNRLNNPLKVKIK